jgi:hypothetical protein
MTNEHEAQTAAALRDLAKQGRTPAELYRELRQLVGPDTHIVCLMKHFRRAFHLSLEEAKPIAAFTRNEGRDIEDEGRLNELMAPVIWGRRTEWDQPAIALPGPNGLADPRPESDRVTSPGRE